VDTLVAGGMSGYRAAIRREPCPTLWTSFMVFIVDECRSTFVARGDMLFGPHSSQLERRYLRIRVNPWRVNHALLTDETPDRLPGKTFRPPHRRIFTLGVFPHRDIKSRGSASVRPDEAESAPGQQLAKDALLALLRSKPRDLGMYQQATHRRK